MAGELAAGADTMGRLPVGMVGVETLLDSPRGQLQRLPPNGRLQRFQVQIVQGLAPQQSFNIPQDLRGEETVE